MGQKVHPKGIRIGITTSWESRWYATKEFPRYIAEDVKVRSFIKKKLRDAGIAKVEIERAASRMRINIYTAKPGIVIGKKGKGREDLEGELKQVVGRDVGVKIIEIRKPDTEATLIAENIAFQLERRINFRRAMKESVNRAVRMGAEGIKVSVGGRLNGAEIARTEKYKEGRVPLHTLRAEIDYGTAEAHTTYGLIGIKVWVFKGERFSLVDQSSLEALQSQ